MKCVRIMCLVFLLVPNTLFALIQHYDVTAEELGRLPILCFAETNATDVTFHVFIRATAGTLNGAKTRLWEIKEDSATSSDLPTIRVAGVTNLLRTTVTIKRRSFRDSRLGVSTFRYHRIDYHIKFDHLLESAYKTSPPDDISKSKLLAEFMKKQYPWKLSKNQKEDSQQPDGAVTQESAPSASP